MKTAEQWLSALGEAVGQDMFYGNPNKPGSRIVDLFKLVQSDARTELLAENKRLRDMIEHCEHLVITYRNHMAGAIFTQDWRDECDKYQDLYGKLKSLTPPPTTKASD